MNSRVELNQHLVDVLAIADTQPGVRRTNLGEYVGAIQDVLVKHTQLADEHIHYVQFLADKIDHFGEFYDIPDLIDHAGHIRELVQDL